MAPKVLELNGKHGVRMTNLTYRAYTIALSNRQNMAWCYHITRRHDDLSLVHTDWGYQGIDNARKAAERYIDRLYTVDMETAWAEMCVSGILTREAA